MNPDDLKQALDKLVTEEAQLEADKLALAVRAAECTRHKMAILTPWLIVLLPYAESLNRFHTAAGQCFFGGDKSQLTVGCHVVAQFGDDESVNITDDASYRLQATRAALINLPQQVAQWRDAIRTRRLSYSNDVVALDRFEETWEKEYENFCTDLRSVLEKCETETPTKETKPAG